MKQGYVEVSPEFVFRGIVGIRVLPQDTFYVLCECELFEEWDGTGEVPVYSIEIERYCGVVDATRSGVKEMKYKVGDRIKAVGFGVGEEVDIGDPSSIGDTGTVDTYNEYWKGKLYKKDNPLIIDWDSGGFDYLDSYSWEKINTLMEENLQLRTRINDIYEFVLEEKEKT